MAGCGTASDAEAYLLGGVNRDEMLGGPAVLFFQSACNFTVDAADGTGFPYGIEDVITVTGANAGQAVAANGWRNVGYTMDGINVNRTRTTVDWDADQQAQVDIIHDAWAHELTTTLVQVSPQNIDDVWQGAGQEVAVGAVPAQTMVTFGKPTTLIHVRVATIHPDKNGRLWMFAYRDCVVIASGALAYTRTGQLGLPITIRPLSDDDVADVNDRVVRLYYTDDPVF